MQSHQINRDLNTSRELLDIGLSRLASDIVEELSLYGCRSRGQGNTNDDMDIPGGEVPYTTTDDVHNNVLLGDDLGRTPWGTNAKDNRAYYIADVGHEIVVKPRESESTDSNSLASTSAQVKRVKAFLDLWCEVNGWKLRQAEVQQRLDRHGEVFDVLDYDPDGFLRVYFGEPVDVGDDPDSRFQDPEDKNVPFLDTMGVRRTRDVRFLPVGYFLGGNWYPELAVSVDPLGNRLLTPGLDPESIEGPSRLVVQHRKRNVLRNDPRGVTLFWPVREELVWAKRLLANMMRVSGFQTAFGAIRYIDASQGADAVRAYLASQQTGTAGAGQHETFDMPAAGVVTVPSSVKYEFPETGLSQEHHILVLVQLLRACAAGMKLPEFMLSANVSEGNFASTLVSEGPFHKAMRWEQSQMVSEDRRILLQAVRYAAASGQFDLRPGDIDAVTIEMKPPRVQTRNRKEDFEVGQKLWEDHLLSGKTLLAQEGHEFESEQAQTCVEVDERCIRADSGTMPDTNLEPNARDLAGSNSDPSAEPGVSGGNPDANPTANP